MINNLFENIPKNLESEVFESLVDQTIKIERIISKGQITPKGQWYDQDENEWVLLMQGAARIEFEEGNEISLKAGDYLNINAHQKHRVSWTSEESETIWLAVFY
jgi:cupin 2 domain-containing protein